MIVWTCTKCRWEYKRTPGVGIHRVPTECPVCGGKILGMPVKDKLSRESCLDGDGYPTIETLDRIKAWPWQDMPGVFALIRELWWQDGWGVSETLSPAEREVCHDDIHQGVAPCRYIRFATGGWSGNESLIYALRENHIVWAMTWVLSARGGLHIFRFREES